MTTVLPADESAALQWGLVNNLREKLALTTSLDLALTVGLDTVIELNRAQFGNIQLFDNAAGFLRIAAQRGFQPDFLDHFAQVSAADGSSCGRALHDRAIVHVEDVQSDPGFASSLAVVARAGYRAVQSAPLLTTRGQFVGVISVHFAEPRPPRDANMLLNRLSAFQIADAVVRLSPPGHWGEQGR